jgi:outer membrane protein OmpA-like peptidoglycan-associated protein
MLAAPLVGCGSAQRADIAASSPRTAAARASVTPSDDVVIAPVRVVAGELRVDRPITFEYRSVELSSAARDTLDGVGAFLMRYPALRIHIEVHSARYSGMNAADAAALSATRSNAIYEYLVAFGVQPARLSRNGYGYYCSMKVQKSPAEMAEAEKVRFVIIGGEAKTGCERAYAFGVTRP